MVRLLDLSHRTTQLVTIMMCVSVFLFSISCTATDRSVTERFALELTTKSPAPRFVPHEVLVKFKGGVSQERIVFILQDNRTDVIAEIQRGRLYHIRILDDRSVESVIT